MPLLVWAFLSITLIILRQDGCLSRTSISCHWSVINLVAIPVQMSCNGSNGCRRCACDIWVALSTHYNIETRGNDSQVLDTVSRNMTRERLMSLGGSDIIPCFDFNYVLKVSLQRWAIFFFYDWGRKYVSKLSISNRSKIISDFWQIFLSATTFVKSQSVKHFWCKGNQRRFI